MKNNGATFKDNAGGVRYTVAFGPMVVRAIVATTNSTSLVVVNLYHYDGNILRQIAAISVPADAGTDGTEVGISLLNETDCPWIEVDDLGNNVIRLGKDETLCVGVQTNPSSGKVLNIVAFGGEE